MITGIEHIAICAKDSKTLAEWYARVFQFRQVYDNGKGTYFLALADGSMLEIMKASDERGTYQPNEQGLRHLALSVNNFDDMVEHLKREGVEEIEELATIKPTLKTFFFRDIESNILHLIYRENPLY